MGRKYVFKYKIFKHKQKGWRIHVPIQCVQTIATTFPTKVPPNWFTTQDARFVRRVFQLFSQQICWPNIYNAGKQRPATNSCGQRWQKTCKVIWWETTITYTNTTQPLSAPSIILYIAERPFLVQVVWCLDARSYSRNTLVQHPTISHICGI